MIQTININCDLGEGQANDAKLMPLIYSCNIACGGHYGDKESIRKTILLAKKHDVKIGAHPSFADQKNFGRIALEMAPERLEKSIVDQVNLFFQIAKQEDVKVHHVKLHGALYNLAAKDEKTAKTVIRAFQQIKRDFKLYTPPGSILSQLAKANFDVIHEAFIDRTYLPNLELTPRTNPGALITQPEQAYAQFQSLYEQHQVKTLDGEIIPLKAATFCIHGDATNSLETLKYIHQKLAHDHS